MPDREYRMCTRCVMDTTDPDISFDENGLCNHCRQYDIGVTQNIATGEEGRRQLNKIVKEIKQHGAGHRYDCIIGVSGGVDSTYAAYQAKKFGLRPLAIHLDNGWDSEVAAENVEKLRKSLDIDLHTWTLDWDEFKDLQLSFLRASTPDAENPTDHAIWATTWKLAKKFRIKYVVTGCNFRTETHLPRAWSQGWRDWKYIKSVHKQFGNVPLRTFPHFTFLTGTYYRKMIRHVHILNYLDYVKKDAMPVLERELGWKYYGGKHYESIWTRFWQAYILPRKFGFDKRHNHLSSLICSGEITRDEALEELKKPTYPLEQQQQDREYVIRKLGLTERDFQKIMGLSLRKYADYPSDVNLYRAYKAVATAYHAMLT